MTHQIPQIIFTQGRWLCETPSEKIDFDSRAMKPPFTLNEFALPKIVRHDYNTLTFTCERMDGEVVTATVDRLFAIANHRDGDTPNVALRRIMAAYQNLTSPKQITA